MKDYKQFRLSKRSCAFCTSYSTVRMLPLGWTRWRHGTQFIYHNERAGVY